MDRAIKLRYRRRQIRDGRRAIAIAVGLALVCFFSTLLLSNYRLVNIVDEQVILETPIYRTQKVQKQRPTLRLADEDSFLGTIKSCVAVNAVGPKGKKDCLQHVRPGSPARIGILSPPGPIAEAFVDWVGEGLRSVGLGPGVPDFVVIPTSHVPPYGYGKSHGWTKIIRLVPFPLVLGAFDAFIHQTLGHGQDLGGTDTTLQSNEPLDPDLLASILRQIIRWHCRLSHVSAHTALMTVSLQNILDQPEETMKKLVSFVLDGNSNSQNGISEVLKVESIPSSDLKTMREALNFVHNQVYTHFPYHGDISRGKDTVSLDDVLKRLNSILGVELSETNNLNDWPCRSFWDVTHNDVTSNKMGPIKAIAESLAPNCTAEYTKCTVRKDICEAEGNTLCK